MAKFRKVQHLRSSVQGKYPTLEQVEYGEITVNFYQGDEFLCIRNKGIKGDGSDDAIVSFRTWPYIQKVIEDNELVTAAALTTIKESCGFNKEGEYVPSSASTYISEATTVTEALDILDKNLAQTYTKDEVLVKLDNIDDRFIALETVIEDNELVTASALTTLKESCGFNKEGEYVPSSASTYISEATTVTEALDILDKNLAQTYTKDEVLVKLDNIDDRFITLETVIEDNEEVTAAALTVLNESCGFNENAKFTPSTNATYISNTNSVTDALNVLDKNLAQTYTKIDDRFITLETVIEDNEEVTAAALTVLNESCGFNENAKFTPSTNATYISNTNSVTDALNVLDNSLSQTQLTLSEAIDVLDTKVPRAITIEHGDSRWDTPSYSDRSQSLSDKNVAFLRNNDNFELTLPFQHLTTIYYAKYVSKSYSQDTYNYIFLVGEYMVLINVTRDDGEITWHPILDRQA